MKKVNKSNWRLWKTVGWIYELTKKAFNIDGDSIAHEEQKKHLMNLLEKNILSFLIWFMSIIVKEEIRKTFSVYQNLIDLFKYLLDGNINPKEVLKNHIHFKSDLGEIRKETQDYKIK